MKSFTPTLVLGVLLALILPRGVDAELKQVWWNITFTNANPDGLFPRRVIGVNGTWPPPPIEVNSDDHLLVHAFNSLDSPTSLHHHGMFFNRTSWSDGAVGVTQCGVPTGSSFTYDINVEDSGQIGTYWVHAHSKGQYVDGLRAPLIIHNAAGETFASSYDDEFTVVLGDWYHQEHDVLGAGFLSTSNPNGIEPIPDSALIYFTHNGRYLPPKSILFDDSAFNRHIVGFNENATLPFLPGKTYRLRIVNTSAFSLFVFYIDGHDMRVIEVDGTDVEPFPVSFLGVTVAQRYSVLVTARNDASSNFVVHANLDPSMFDHVPPGLNLNVSASITYNPEAPLAPSVDAPVYPDVNDTAIVPFNVEPELPPPDHVIELNAFFATMDNGINRAMFNNVTYNSPLTPSILSQLTTGQNSTVVSEYGPQSFVLQHNEVVELRVRNWDTGKHPFHLHGHKFQIVHKSDDVTSSDPIINPIIIPEGQPNPMRRDTIQIRPLGHAFLRFRADNPGVWFFHCHIEWHLDAGLAVTLIEAPLQAQQVTQLPAFVPAQCIAQGLPASGNAAGLNSTTDLTGLPVGPFPVNTTV